METQNALRTDKGEALTFTFDDGKCALYSSALRNGGPFCSSDFFAVIAGIYISEVGTISGFFPSLMEVEDFVDRLGTLGDDLVAHLGHARLRRLSYKDWSHRKLSDISFSQVFYSCASAQPRCQAVLLVSSFGLPARPASTPRSWSSISSSVSSWASCLLYL